MLKKLSKLKREIILVVVTSLVVGILVFILKQSDPTVLKLPYPNTKTLPSKFNNLSCEEMSETYMRALPQDSNIFRPQDNNAVVLSVQSYNDYKINLNIQDGRVIFSDDNGWELEDKPFRLQINTPYRLGGSLVTIQERSLNTDIAWSFLLDKKTSLLILTHTTILATQYESFGTISRLFTCEKLN